MPNEELADLAQQLRMTGRELDLPLVATCADISSARPTLDAQGIPVASRFDFTDVGAGYWNEGDLALRNAIVAMIRHLGEPFYYRDGTVGGWRPIRVTDKLAQQAQRANYAVRSAIVVPVRLPCSVLGAVVWATDRPGGDVATRFAQHALMLHGLATRFVAACDNIAHGTPEIGPCTLTRREVQCLKLVAAGKTDGEIATILGLASPTVRFHMKKASAKLEETGRLRTAQRAIELGYVSSRL
ncbi:helix-turn-helix transcriptional regulator [Novosphingobium sp. YJ-S2-02]|uniref:Helix-turn-helix transcriptional regulator n=1 Tax=Novosphingobium aureum TaxID=2792964 RepID=A0A931MKI6_9SPHN|nr:helix-turn-helix transcriptional regulator [Novosphingobium aureum]MBH0112031.1 helix-turn-helix transcriptional regulator [Novosphingobium aureum]